MNLQKKKTDGFLQKLQEITNYSFVLIDIDNIPVIEISDSKKLVNNPVISVAMITYDHEQFIAQSIEDIVNQKTEYDFELIIGEDCSTDNTREIVLEYQKKYPEKIRVLISEKNVGARKNLLRVENACRGKYIAYCEGDDYWHRPDKLQIQISFLESNPEYSLVESNVIWNDLMNSFQKEIRSKKKLNDNNALFEIWQEVRPCFTCVTCGKRQLLEEVKQEYPGIFSYEYWPCGDVPRFLAFAKKGKVRNIDAAFGTINRHMDSATNPQSMRRKAEYHFKNVVFSLFIENQWPYLKGKNQKSKKRELLRSIYFSLLCRDMSLMPCIKNIGIIDKNLQIAYIKIIQKEFLFRLCSFFARLHNSLKALCRNFKSHILKR